VCLQAKQNSSDFGEHWRESGQEHTKETEHLKKKLDTLKGNWTPQKETVHLERKLDTSKANGKP
jgi:hypothetical protein